MKDVGESTDVGDLKGFGASKDVGDSKDVSLRPPGILAYPDRKEEEGNGDPKDVSLRPPGILADRKEEEGNADPKDVSLRPPGILAGNGDPKDVWPRPPGILACPKLKHAWLRQPGILAHPPIPEPLSKSPQQDRAQFQADNQTDSMDSQTCQHCGILFQSPHYLDMHLQKKCTMQGESSDEDDNDSSWVDLIQQAFDDLNQTYQKKKKGYMKEGLEEEEAGEKAIEELHPKYRKSLVEKYRTFLEQLYDLDHNTRHKEVMQDIQWYMTWKRYSFEKALDVTLKKKRHFFDEVLEDQNELKEEETDVDDETEVDDDETEVDDDETEVDDDEAEVDEDV